MRKAPFLLALAALLADTSGAHSFAFELVLAAVIASAVAGLAWYGELVEAAARSREEALGRTQTAFAVVALALLVLAAAVRSPALLDSSVPALGTSALVGALGLFAVQGLVALGSRLPERRVAALRSRA